MVQVKRTRDKQRQYKKNIDLYTTTVQVIRNLVSNKKNNAMSTTTIQCPKCKHEFPSSDIIDHQLQHLMKAEKEILERQFSEKEVKLRSFQSKLKQQELEIENTVTKKLAQREGAIKSELKEKVKVEYQFEISELQNEILEKQKLINNAKSKELELAKLQRKFEEQKRDFEIEMEQALSKERSTLESQISLREQQKHSLKYAEKEKQLFDLKKQLEEAQRKAEQGSMQSQGEILELEIERILSDKFPFDAIEEIKKGQNGADVLLKVLNRSGKVSGVIAFEAKRAKAFNEQWIDKLKQDMQIHGADIGVIVTEVMPGDMKQFGLRSGVWICTFHEAEGLAMVLRESLMSIALAKQSLIGKESKMEMLYEYMCSTEFKLQIEGIVEAFSCMKTDLDKEKRVMQRIWKEREKQIDRVVGNTINLYGSVKGIAGKSIQDVKALEISSDELF